MNRTKTIRELIKSYVLPHSIYDLSTYKGILECLRLLEKKEIDKLRLLFIIFLTSFILNTIFLLALIILGCVDFDIIFKVDFIGFYFVNFFGLTYLFYQKEIHKSQKVRLYESLKGLFVENNDTEIFLSNSLDLIQIKTLIYDHLKGSFNYEHDIISADQLIKK
ncbi:hypothetical protein QQ008_00305 [Fulvivirgaceae bacterium BMA10]|uniref:SMODS and SLOG-associating 2TM effector domain-containing protein n=1 Tax=Splendidivirga corallicola TaxID=3051826 RepID=A0ABT8KHQ2_9BACT|nr:hypothetical protein [Fulvivirgaceae bacterium BMA10]